MNTKNNSTYVKIIKSAPLANMLIMQGYHVQKIKFKNGYCSFVFTIDEKAQELIDSYIMS